MSRPGVVHAPMAIVPTGVAASIPFVAQREVPAHGGLSFAQDRADFNNPIRRFALFCALGFIFVQVSFLHEIIGVTTGIRSFLPSIFGIPAAVGIIATGGVRRALKARTAWFWIALAVWLVVAAALSYWPGGSFADVRLYFQYQFPILFFVAGLVVTWKEFRWVLYSIVSAGIVNELTARFLSDDRTSRLQLEIVTIGNSNDFAAQLLTILPLFWFVAMYPKVPKVVRMVLLAAIPYDLYLSLSTGSRGALVAIAVTYGFVVFRASGAQRLVLAVVMPVIVAVLLMALPGDTMRRLATVFSDDVTVDAQDLEAVQSSLGRKELLRLSIQYTLEHPLFGVGPGQFNSFEGASAREQGKHGFWTVPHNSFTQLSSEAGIPALILLLGGLISAYRGISKTLREARKRHNATIERCGFALMVSLVSFSCAAFFLSLAFRFYFPLLSGLAIAFCAVAQNEFSTSDARAAHAGGAATQET
jgi:hypothetical protein